MSESGGPKMVCRETKRISKQQAQPGVFLLNDITKLGSEDDLKRKTSIQTKSETQWKKNENDKPSRRQTSKHRVPEGTISMSTISWIRK